VLKFGGLFSKSAKIHTDI